MAMKTIAPKRAISVILDSLRPYGTFGYAVKVLWFAVPKWDSYRPVK